MNQIKEYKIELFKVNFSPNTYTIDLAIVSGNNHFDMIEDVLKFTITEGNRLKRGSFPSHAKVYLNSKWEKI